MADITMCNGVRDNVVCPFRSVCYRFNAVPSEWQSYFEAPFDMDGCTAFVEDRNWTGKTGEKFADKIQRLEDE